MRDSRSPSRDQFSHSHPKSRDSQHEHPRAKHDGRKSHSHGPAHSSPHASKHEKPHNKSNFVQRDSKGRSRFTLDDLAPRAPRESHSSSHTHSDESRNERGHGDKAQKSHKPHATHADESHGHKTHANKSHSPQTPVEHPPVAKPAHAIHANAGADRPAIENTFKALHLAEPLLKALHEEGYDNPTPIQAQSIPLIMAAKDVLGCAQTGTGKTAAFAVPILHRLMQDPPDKTRKGPALPRVLVLSPTRELATQIGDSFATYGRHTGLVHTVIFGGVSQFHQVKALHKGVDILVATPGRLIDLMEQRLVTLSNIKIFVLDEADRMLDMGFIKPIQRIAAAISKGGAGASGRQTLLFSATMPREIQHLADALLHNPAKVSVTPVSSAAPLIEQQLYHVHKLQKQALLTHLLEELDSQRAVVFTKTKHGADKVQRKLRQSGITAEAIHGNKAQNYRTRALGAFRDGRSRVLVATDVAARGLDVDDVTHVFNYDLPMEPEAYVHRIGRTGRMGKQGLAISFCDAEERDLLRQIERLTGKKIPNQALPPLPSVAELASNAEAKQAEWESKHGNRTSRNTGMGHSRHAPRDDDRPYNPATDDYPSRPAMRTSGDDHGQERKPQRTFNKWKKPRGRK